MGWGVVITIAHGVTQLVVLAVAVHLVRSALESEDDLKITPIDTPKPVVPAAEFE